MAGIAEGNPDEEKIGAFGVGRLHATTHLNQDNDESRQGFTVCSP